jgi:hypothetical protein
LILALLLAPSGRWTTENTAHSTTNVIQTLNAVKEKDPHLFFASHPPVLRE